MKDTGKKPPMEAVRDCLTYFAADRPPALLSQEEWAIVQLLGAIRLHAEYQKLDWDRILTFVRPFLRLSSEEAVGRVRDAMKDAVKKGEL